VVELDRPIHKPNDAGIKALLDEYNPVIREAHFAGANGNEVVQRRTVMIDRVLRETHELLTNSGPMPALLAIGGYGRGELNPHSDIDIMFLCRDDADRARAPELLYRLWDAGLDIGYSVRSATECVHLARQDNKIRTSLMEARLISGDPLLFASFIKSMHSDVFFWKASSYIQEKLVERNAARLKYGGSIYLREPNIKEGAGGLRDFHTALWIAFVHFRTNSPEDLVKAGVLSEGQLSVFKRSRNFLWRVRNEIHYLSGRKNDQLTFDLQERAAQDFHYRDSVHLLAVERFMKAYFLHARNIREFSNVLTEAVLPKPAHRWFERARPLGHFSLIGRTLIPQSTTSCKNDSSLIMTAFELAQTRHAIFSEKLRSLIKACRIETSGRTSPAASATFQAILNDPDNLSETLTLMKDLRFLGRYLPEFREIQALARHDFYHKYTVDEHILLAIKSLQDLWIGNSGLSSLHEAIKSVKKRWVLFLTVLLHDLGKAYRTGHEGHGAELAETILHRLGIAGEDRERIIFLIKNHLVMSTISQRRELNDRKVIEDFARLIGDRENLIMLYLLTYADTCAVNPTAWTQWKAVLLQDLYRRTEDLLSESANERVADQSRLIAAMNKIRTAAVTAATPGDIDVFLRSMPEQYILYTSTNRIIDHLKMMKRLPEEKLVIQYRHYPEKGYTELTVCAYDAYGLFYRSAGTIAAKNLSILRAQVYTSKNGVMIDTFRITDPDGKICAYDEAFESLRTELRIALTSGSRPPEPGLYAAAKVVPGAITPVVEFDNTTSDAWTIIDIEGRDRVGFLYQVTKALFDLNLDIGSAKIVTQGARVMDSFYVTDMCREKVKDDLRLYKIRDTLLNVLA